MISVPRTRRTRRLQSLRLAEKMKRAYHSPSQRNLGGVYFAGSAKLLDLEPTAGLTGTHDGGVGGTTEAPGRPEVVEQAPERITRRHTCCGEARRQLADRTGKALQIVYNISQTTASRPRASACGAARAPAAPAGAAAAGRASAKAPREKAVGGEKDPPKFSQSELRLRNVIDINIFTDILTCRLSNRGSQI